MRVTLLAAFAAFAAGACAGHTSASDGAPASAAIITSPERDALVAAERAFAAKSLDAGTRNAFLAYLAEDAVLFIPRASPGRPFFEAQPTIAGSRLEWAPIYAEVSAAGDLGFTTGPYEARASARVDSVTAYGNFVSIWKQEAGSREWRVAIDLGTTNDRPAAARRLRSAYTRTRVAGRDSAAAAADTAHASGLGDRAMTPLGADSAFSTRAAAEGTAAAFSLASVDARLHRERAEPIVGRAAAVEALRRSGERFAWHPEAGVEAQSADLGYTYGTYGGTAPGAADEGAYVRIWRRGVDGRWRLALDITNPFPR